MLHSLWILAATFFTVLTYVFVKWVPPQTALVCGVDDQHVRTLVRMLFYIKNDAEQNDRHSNPCD